MVKSKKSAKKKADYVLSEKELKVEEQQEKEYIHNKQEDEKRIN